MTQHESDSSTSSPQPDWSRRGAQILAVIAIVVLIAVGWSVGRPDPLPQRPANPTAGAANDPNGTGGADGETHEPYHYDEQNNRWWHVENGRGHWHQGPPPPEDQRN